MTLLLGLAVFAGTFVAAALAVLLVVTIQRRGVAVGPSEPESADAPNLLKDENLSTMPVWQQLLEYLDWSRFLKDRIEQAGVSWSVGRVTLAMLLLAAVSFALVSDLSWTPPGASIISAWIAAFIPYWIISTKRKKRLRKMEAQFPDALDSLARAMRAGHALSNGIVMLGNETPAPLGPELRKVAEEQRLGMPWSVVLEHLSRRVPIHEVRLFAAAVQVQTRSGGRLTDVLERLGVNIRETAALRGEIRAISAQGRMTGGILTAMPAFIGAAMYATNPSYLNVLFAHPKGKLMLWGALGCIAVGHFVIQRIVTIRLPQ